MRQRLDRSRRCIELVFDDPRELEEFVERSRRLGAFKARLDGAARAEGELTLALVDPRGRRELPVRLRQVFRSGTARYVHLLEPEDAELMLGERLQEAIRPEPGPEEPEATPAVAAGPPSDPGGETSAAFPGRGEQARERSASAANESAAEGSPPDEADEGTAESSPPDEADEGTAESSPPDEADEGTAESSSPGGAAEIPESPAFRIRRMNVSERMRLATRARRGERQILLRDSSPQVLLGLLANPRIEEREVIEVVKSHHAAAGLLQRVAGDRRWKGSYAIKLALVKNPKTPTPLALKLVATLRRDDLRALGKSGEVREAIRGAALRLYLSRR